MADNATTEKPAEAKAPTAATAKADKEVGAVMGTAGSLTVDDVRRLGSQPEGLAPQGDVVAMVARDVNGHPYQSENFTVLVPEGVSEPERAAHWNRAGEDQGAKHLSGGGVEEVPTYTSWDGLSDEERQQRSEVEHRELYRHNFREELKA
jgi:hypothetical protein